MDLRTEDWAFRGETARSVFRPYVWVEVCPDCGSEYLATLLDAVCQACDRTELNPYRRWDR